jgi:hypothetical protein
LRYERASREKSARENAATKKGQAKEAEDAMAAQVEWDDFVVVQLVDLEDDTRYKTHEL